MPRIASLLVAVACGGAVLGGASVARAGCPALVMWRPADAGATGANARAALQREAKTRGCKWLDAPAEATAAPPPLATALAEALSDYRAFKFADAVRKLDALATQAQATGGGDLDAHQLAELYLFRGLSGSELGHADAAWDDFVRAARLDPARVLDPAQFPPRAVAAYRRAAADAAALPRARVRVMAPTDARVLLDGRDASTPIDVPLGTHLLRVRADGFVPFGGAVEVTGTATQLQPQLAPERAPPTETLLRLAGGPPALVAALERAGDAWRLGLRAVGSDGNTRALERTVDADSAASAATTLTRQLLDPAPPQLIATPNVTAQPKRKKLPAWGWGLIGAGVAAIAIVVPIAVVFGSPAPQGTVGGSIGPLK